MNFVKKALAGKVMFDEIDDFVDKWHLDDQGKTLPEYLGLTREEYAVWVQNPDVVPQIISARKFGRPFEIVLEEAFEERLAARSDAGDRLASIKRWLKKRGKL